MQADETFDRPVELLGGLSARTFMRRYWQKRPLLVRQALGGTGGTPAPLARADLLSLACRVGSDARVVIGRDAQWEVRPGPLRRRDLPSVRQPGWTVLVHGVDLHAAAARELLERFRFIADARMDDLMISYATDGGGVGPHVDAYDVFLIQVHGQRRWRVGQVHDPRWVRGLPLKILQRFESQHEWVLEPGDLLYLPPGWGHDGVAQGECMTCSVGFRASSTAEVAGAVLSRVADGLVDDAADQADRYADPGAQPTAHPARIPAGMQRHAQQAVRRALAHPGELDRALGEWLSEPKATTWFEMPCGRRPRTRGVRLSARSRMLYDDHFVYLNGESFNAQGADRQMLEVLADTRCLTRQQCQALSKQAQAVVQQWWDDGWIVSS